MGHSNLETKTSLLYTLCSKFQPDQTRSTTKDVQNKEKHMLPPISLPEGIDTIINKYQSRISIKIMNINATLSSGKE